MSIQWVTAEMMTSGKLEPKVNVVLSFHQENVDTFAGLKQEVLKIWSFIIQSLQLLLREDIYKSSHTRKRLSI